MADIYFRYAETLEQKQLPADVRENPAQLFSAEYWDQQNQIIGTSGGRNTVWFISAGQGQWVLRHYYRGGLPGKLLNDQYFFTGTERTRAFREFDLLEAMKRMELPVPSPVAAKVERTGLVYTSDLLIEHIADSEDVYHRLLHSGIAPGIWQDIGKTIRKFHDQGVWHADLNCHNILLTNEQTWLIDFDRCRFRTGKTWQARNLLRLKRSLYKESERAPEFHFRDSDWIELMRGYSLAR